MLLVTGASGQLGHAIVRSLVELVPAKTVVATCRHPDKVDDLKELGVDVRHADFNDPASLQHAFKDATQILLVSSDAQAHGGDALAQHGNAIHAAEQAGARRIVYTSHMAVGAGSAFPPMHDHAATEAMLRDCGITWTALRHGFYAASGIAMLEQALETCTLDAPADGPVAWTAHADLAEAAARILVDDTRESGATPPLTGPEALDLDDLAALASNVSGKPITRRVRSDDEMRRQLERKNMPAAVINIFMGYHQAARHGEFATTDPALGNLLGRTPRCMRDVMVEAM